MHLHLHWVTERFGVQDAYLNIALHNMKYRRGTIE